MSEPSSYYSTATLTVQTTECEDALPVLWLVEALNLTDRATRDIDVVARVEGEAYICAEPLPPVLKEAVEDTALLINLDPRWLNGAPTGFYRKKLEKRYM